MKRILIVLITLFMAYQADGQAIYKRKNRPLVDMNLQNKLSGWLVEPGLTYTLTRFRNPAEELYRNADTVVNATFDPSGRLGLYLGVGRYRLFKYGYLINYMDYSLAFKQLKGRESYTSETLLESSSLLLAESSGKGNYRHSFITGNFNLNSIQQLSDYSFLQYSLGGNVDYNIIRLGDYTTLPPFGNSNTPGKFMADLHFKLGYGWKYNGYLFIIPTIETPILSFMDWDNGRSTYNMFFSRYRPLIFTIRLAWLRDSKGADCPPVYGSPDDKRKQEQFQMSR